MNRRAFTLLELVLVTGILMIICVPAYQFVSRGMTFQKHFDHHRALDNAARDAADNWHRDVSQATAIGRIDEGVVIRISDRQIEYVFKERRLIRREPNRVDQVFAENVIESAIEPLEGGLWRLSWTAKDTDGMKVWMRKYGALAAPVAEPAELKPEAAR